MQENKDIEGKVGILFNRYILHKWCSLFVYDKKEKKKKKW